MSFVYNTLYIIVFRVQSRHMETAERYVSVYIGNIRDVDRRWYIKLYTIIFPVCESYIVRCVLDSNTFLKRHNNLTATTALMVDKHLTRRRCVYQACLTQVPVQRSSILLLTILDKYRTSLGERISKIYERALCLSQIRHYQNNLQ